ncbi:hypothetical protein ACNKHS_00260 [Shigella flexneri]
MGGQTALNCALELERQGVLEEFGVTMMVPPPTRLIKQKTVAVSTWQ